MRSVSKTRSCAAHLSLEGPPLTVRMPHLCKELHLWRQERVLWREDELGAQKAALVQRVVRPYDHDLPLLFVFARKVPVAVVVGAREGWIESAMKVGEVDEKRR